MLTLPYAAGAEIAIEVDCWSSSYSCESIVAESTNPDVFSIRNQPDHYSIMWCDALEAGEAELVFYKSTPEREEILRTQVVVREPDEVRLTRVLYPLNLWPYLRSSSSKYWLDWRSCTDDGCLDSILRCLDANLVADGWLDAIVDMQLPPELGVVGDEILILEDQTARFAMRPFDEKRPLHGHGAVHAKATESSVLVELDDGGDCIDDTFRISGTTADETSMGIAAGKYLTEDRKLMFVPSEDVASLEFWTPEDYGSIGLVPNMRLMIVATARAANNTVIFGVEPKWKVEGHEVAIGEAFGYYYSPQSDLELEVLFGNLSYHVVVHGKLERDEDECSQFMPGGANDE